MGVIAAVNNFTYLAIGSSRIINVRLSMRSYSARLGKAAKAFSCLRPSIFDSKSLSVKIKGKE